LAAKVKAAFLAFTEPKLCAQNTEVDLRGVDSCYARRQPQSILQSAAILTRRFVKNPFMLHPKPYP